jgi:hypothetical protein
MDEQSELGGASTSRLSQALSLRDADGHLIVLAGAGVELPTVVSRTLPPATHDGEQRFDIVTSSGVLVADLRLGPRRIDSDKKPIVLALSIGADAIFAEATQAQRAVPALCRTLMSFAQSATDMVHCRPSRDHTALYVGVIEDDDDFVSVIAPGFPLPHRAVVQVKVGTAADRRLFFDLLIVSPEDLYAEEIEVLDASGHFPLIDDDYDEIIEFDFEDPGEHSVAEFVDIELVWGQDDTLTVRALADGKELEVQSDQARERLDLAFSASKAREWVLEFPAWADRESSDVEAELTTDSLNEHSVVQLPQSEAALPLRNAAIAASRDAHADAEGGWVFISHRSETDGAFAATLVETLEESGIKCWIAPRNINAGSNWHRTIMAAIERCDSMIVVVTAGAVDSEFVQAEVNRALRRRKLVVPLMLDVDAALTDLDARLETRQHVNWFAGEAEAIKALRQAVQVSQKEHTPSRSDT